MTKCSQEIQIHYKNILNSEWSEGSNGFTIMLIIFFFCKQFTTRDQRNV
jgi:hypothetical protein